MITYGDVHEIRKRIREKKEWLEKRDGQSEELKLICAGMDMAIDVCCEVVDAVWLANVANSYGKKPVIGPYDSALALCSRIEREKSSKNKKSPPTFRSTFPPYAWRALSNLL